MPCKEKCTEHDAVCGLTHGLGKIHAHNYNSNAPPNSIYGPLMQFHHQWHKGDRVNNIYLWGKADPKLPYYEEPKAIVR